jgi:hypothetical protein
MSKAPQYYTLITAEILFQQSDDPEIYTARINGVLADPQPEITAKLIGKAQQIAQHQLDKRNQNGQDLKIIDVVILNLTALGRMTDEEFQGTSIKDAGPMATLKHLMQDDPFTSI